MYVGVNLRALPICFPPPPPTTKGWEGRFLYLGQSGTRRYALNGLRDAPELYLGDLGNYDVVLRAFYGTRRSLKKRVILLKKRPILLKNTPDAVKQKNVRRRHTVAKSV